MPKIKYIDKKFNESSVAIINQATVLEKENKYKAILKKVEDNWETL